MPEIIRAAIEWAREQHLSPWAAVWLFAGYLSLRLLAMIGAAVSKTASGLFSHYNSMIQTLERQVEVAKHECAAAKSALVDMQHELEQQRAIVVLLRSKLAGKDAADE